MKRFIINLLERLRVRKSKRNDVDVALTVANSATEDASFSEDTVIDQAGRKTKDVELSLPRSCMNCGEVLTGPFCFACGQKEGDIRRPIWSLLGELLDNVVAPDSKLFKTLLLLLFMPGKLTHDYNSGKRARFIPPLRLYITITFAFFALLLVADVLILDIKFTLKEENRDGAEQSEQLSSGQTQGGENSDGKVVNDFLEGWNSYEPDDKQPSAEPTATPATPTVLAEGAEEATVQNSEASQGGESAITEGGTVDNTVPEKQGLRDVVARLREKYGEDLKLGSDQLSEAERAEVSAALDEDLKNLPAIARNAIKDTVFSDELDVDLDDLIDDIGEDVPVAINEDNIKINADGFPYDVSFDMFVKRTDEEREGIREEELQQWKADTDDEEWTVQLVEGFSEALKDPSKFNDVFNDWLPRILFIMVPFFALILRLFHWGKKRFYFNQLIFSLHFHTFLFLIFTGFIFIIPVTGGEMAGPIFWLLSSIYIIVALKYGQGQGWIKAVLKAGPIWVSYSFFLVITLLLSVGYGLSGRSLGDLYNMISNGGV
ncbi:DUF3667 domain-containing protein [Kordiimonas sp. SCSIO 12610]|uniref:DUF3667 domain-containing protein n=1 Tax=Kordiimonas sp. SCSIO 12610 TaxID=2829597 RepID=UPI00210AB86F|nr:DUF3667 domain-containing protein [Kordiimonas sp. SCSIO 12610]UTW56535.1 DUF3667 domain-containing protein [Kordiimonas sp. SCSIO 12610]